MKKIIYMLTFVCCTSVLLLSCSDDEPSGTSIFIDEDPSEWSDFDKWLEVNYRAPYNIRFIYQMEDIESSLEHNLASADTDKSIVLAKLIKHLWIEAYNEISGTDFTKMYIPRVIHLVGSAAINSNGTIVLGTAEGGLKVTLYMVNYLDIDNLDLDLLNELYFKTMHHEFTHILTQTKHYDRSFEKVSQADYVSGNWYTYSDEKAFKAGFVSPYAMMEANEDFAENLSIYLTNTPEYWESMLQVAGPDGSAIILEKFEFVRSYLSESWGIDIDELRDIILRRSTEIDFLDYTDLKIN